MARLELSRLVLTVGSVLALVAAACGGATTSETDSGPSTSAVATTADPVSTSAAPATTAAVSSSSSTSTMVETTMGQQPTIELTFSDPELVGTLSGNVSDVAVADAEIVAVGFGGVVEDSGQDFVLVVYRTSDPATWPEQLDPVPSPGVVFMSDVAAAGSGLIAVGSGWDQSQGSLAGRVWSSPDGDFWSEIESTAFSDVELLTDVEAVDGGYSLVGGPDGGPAALWTSPDGVGWNRVETTADTPLRMVAITKRGSEYVGVGGNAGEAAVWMSDDGVSWNLAWSEDAAETHMHDVVVLGDWFVAAGYRGAFQAERQPAVWVSPDGIEWQRIDVDQPGAEFLGMDVYEGGLILVGAVYPLGAGPDPGCQPCPAVWQVEVP